MTDAKDAVRAAKAQNQRLAASCLVRKESLAADLANLEKQKASAAALATSSDPETRREASDILRIVEQRIVDKQSELATADTDLEQALGELRELDKLAGKAAAADAAAIAASALGGDPILRSPEEIALDNARGHIARLEAQTRMAPVATEIDSKGRPSTMTEAEARAKLDEMRAKLASSGSSTSKGPATKSLDPKPPEPESSASKPSSPRPKKTL